MKQLLRKIFFWDVPAKGAFWAITCLFVGNSLWFTLYQLLWLSDCGLVSFNFMSERFEREVLVWAVGHLVIVFYALTVFLHALWLLFKKCRRKRDYQPILMKKEGSAIWRIRIRTGILSEIPMPCS